jgi:hypothetical protein
LGIRREKNAYNGASDAFNEASDAFNEASDAFNEASDTFNEASDAFNEASDTFNEASDVFKGASDSFKDVSDSFFGIFTKKHIPPFSPDCSGNPFVSRLFGVTQKIGTESGKYLSKMLHLSAPKSIYPESALDFVDVYFD